MKRFLVPLALISLIFTTVSVNPSHAFFGLSSCEKLKSRVSAEEKIGVSLWKSFDADRKTNLARTDTVWNEQILNDLLLVLGSDDKFFTDMSKYPNCFTSAQNAYLRKLAQTTKNYMTAFTKELSDVAAGRIVWKHYDFKGIYDEYVEIYKTLKTVK